MIAGQSSCVVHKGSLAGLRLAGESFTPDLTDQSPGAAKGPCDLAYAAAVSQPPLDLRISIRCQLPPRHGPLPFVPLHDGTGPFRPCDGSAPVGPIRGNRRGPISGNQVGTIPRNRVGSIRGNSAITDHLRQFAAKSGSSSYEIHLPESGRLRLSVRLVACPSSPTTWMALPA